MVIGKIMTLLIRHYPDLSVLTLIINYCNHSQISSPQVVMLQKALAASGASPEEIAAILAKAAGTGLDDDEITSIMSAVMGNSDLSKEDVENMMNLQKSLKTGGFRKAGVTPEVRVNETNTG